MQQRLKENDVVQYEVVDFGKLSHTDSWNHFTEMKIRTMTLRNF